MMHPKQIYLLVIAVLVTLGVVASLVALANSSGGLNVVLFFQSLFVLFLSIGPLVSLKFNIPFISVRTGASIMFALTFGVWPLAYMVTPDVSGGYISVWVSRPDDFFIETMWYAIVGILCFQLSYLFPVGQQLAKRFTPQRAGWSRDRIYLISIVATVASLISAIAVWSQLGVGGSASALFGRAKVVLDGYHYLALGFALLRVSILISWAYSIVRKFPRSVIYGQVILYTMFMLFMGGRNQVISLWLMLFLTYILLTSRTVTFRKISSFRMVSIATLVIIGSIILLIVVRGFRTTVDVSSTGLGVAIVQNLVDSLAVFSTSILKEFDQLEVFATVVAIIPEQIPYLYGKSFLDIFTLPIPRSVWPDKPIPARLILGQLMRSRDVGIPPTMIGEFFFNFGLAGVVAGMSLFGVLSRGLDSWAYMYRTNPIAIIFFVFVLANLPIITTRYFYGWFGALLIFTFILWLVNRFLRIQGNRNNYSPARVRRT